MFCQNDVSYPEQLINSRIEEDCKLGLLNIDDHNNKRVEAMND